MAIPLPDLDDRRWDDLVEEGRALIPFHAPEWTDHNAHDPGITLLELFAWLAEQDLFELNQITDRQRRRLLALAGVAPLAAQPARALLELELSGSISQAMPAGLEFAGRDAFGESVRFRATHDLTAHPGAIAALQTEFAGEFRNLTGPWKRGEALQPFGYDPARGASFLIGVAGATGWSAGDRVSLGFTIDGDDRGDPDHHSARIRWEVLNSAGTWVRMDATDGTRALSRSGRVEFDLSDPPGARQIGAFSGPLVWLRARIIRGRHDAAPVLRSLALNAVEVEQAVPAMTRLRFAPKANVPQTLAPVGEWLDPDFDLDERGRITRLAFTPPQPGRPPVRLIAWQPADDLALFEAAAIGVGTGAPSFALPLSGDLPIAASLAVTTFEGDPARAWELRPDFDASRRADAHVTIDAGQIVTGDGEHGRTVPAGAKVLVTADGTRGAGGNLAAGAIDSVADSARNGALHAAFLTTNLFHRISNRSAATGGTAAETIRAAIARARADREAPLRAVTLDDHEVLALATPGARIARAEARANIHPGFPCLLAPGIVTVLVLPHLPVDRPEPTAGLREVVAEWLNDHRVIGSRIEVAGPVYAPVSVRAEVGVSAGARSSDLAALIAERIDRFLDPLTGGPDGNGWPFGRDVYRSELLQLIAETEGVEHVRALELVDAAGNVSCGNFCVGPFGLPLALPHQITRSVRSTR